MATVPEHLDCKHNFCFGLTSPLVQLFRNEITEVVPHFGGKTRVGTLSLIVHTCRFLRADSLVPPERASAVKAMNHIELSDTCLYNRCTGLLHQTSMVGGQQSASSNMCTDVRH